jgi:dTMP kinase
MDLDWCKNSDVGLIGMMYYYYLLLTLLRVKFYQIRIAPDCIIYLDMSVEAAAERGAYGEERYEKVDFQRKVREQFMELKEYEEKHQNPSKWHVLDARKSKEELFAEIGVIAKRVIDEVEGQPLTKLW